MTITTGRRARARRHQNLYVGLGSDYSQNNGGRKRSMAGTVLKIDPFRHQNAGCFSFVNPMGLP